MINQINPPTKTTSKTEKWNNNGKADSGLLPGTETNGSSKRERNRERQRISLFIRKKKRAPNPSLAKTQNYGRDLVSFYLYISTKLIKNNNSFLSKTERPLPTLFQSLSLSSSSSCSCSYFQERGNEWPAKFTMWVLFRGSEMETFQVKQRSLVWFLHSVNILGLFGGRFYCPPLLQKFYQ